MAGAQRTGAERGRESGRSAAQNSETKFRIWPEQVYTRDGTRHEISFRGLRFGRSRSIQETPWKADGVIAEDLGLHHSVVKKQREKLRDEALLRVSRSRIWPEQIWGRDGRSQRMNAKRAHESGRNRSTEEIGFEKRRAASQMSISEFQHSYPPNCREPIFPETPSVRRAGAFTP